MRNDNFKYVFVCGLHRSGTTALARDIAKFKDCTAFANTGVPMDEGQHLQDVYPRDYTSGGPGRFGFNPATHLTEASPLLTPENAAKILRSWEPYWDSDKTIRIEKTPGNLLMTRFLQAAFPPAYFVVIQRHPVAVSLATQKWSAGARPHNLFDHGLWCHKLFDEDKKHLARVYEIMRTLFSPPATRFEKLPHSWVPRPLRLRSRPTDPPDHSQRQKSPRHRLRSAAPQKLAPQPRHRRIALLRVGCLYVHPPALGLAQS